MMIRLTLSAKNLCLFALKILAFLPVLANAQTLSTVVEGLGDFKIGITDVSVIDKIAQELKTKVKVTDSNFKRYDYGDGVFGDKIYNKKLYELIRNSKKLDETNYLVSSCNKVRTFLIPKYTIANNPIKELELHFYEGKLFLIRSMDSDTGLLIEKAFMQKYEVINSIKNATVSLCKTEEEKDQAEVVAFGKGDVLALSSQGYGTDYDCKPYVSGSISIYSQNITSLVKKCESEGL